MIFTVPDMSCDHCRMRIEKSLSGLGGIESIKIDITKKTVEITGTAAEHEIEERIRNAGYSVLRNV
jgi:copper chaperone